MNLNNLAQKHFNWVEEMNWHNKTVLEALGLIASEIGEAAYEYLDDVPTDHFGEELADIMLRTLDLACWQKVNLNKEIENINIEWKHQNIPKMFMQLMYEFGNLINTSRKKELDESFNQAITKFTKGIIEIALFSNINLEKEILLKMEINKKRGTRGRVI